VDSTVSFDDLAIHLAKPALPMRKAPPHSP
jgi:hypothetical protein